MEDNLDRPRRGETTSHTMRGASQSERFETLIDEMSSAMSRVPGHEIDGAIQQWLRKIVLALDIDRSTVWERVLTEAQFIGTHCWGRPDVPKMPRNPAGMKLSPWATGKILAGETIIYSSTIEL